MDSALIPEIGTVPQALRTFRLAWAESLVRTEDGSPVLPPRVAARYANVLTFLDVRPEAMQTGPAGRIPGSKAVTPDDAVTRCSAFGRESPIVVVGDTTDAGASVARALEAAGHRLVAALYGGIHEYRALGFAVARHLGPEDRRVVDVPVAWEGERRTLTREAVLEHVGDPRAVLRQKLASLLVHGGLSCVDGRDPVAVLGTPGGDTGELLLALTAVERVRGRALTEAEVEAALLARLDVFGACHLHTDISSANRAIAAIRADTQLAPYVAGIGESLEWRRFWRRPPEPVHRALAALASDPAHLGCGHVKRSLTMPDLYETRAELVRSLLAAFFLARFRGADSAAYGPLPGGHAEGAVLRIRTAADVDPFESVPLVSPLCHGTQTFVAHPEVASRVRKMTLDLLARVGLLPVGRESAIGEEAERLAAVQLGATLGALAAGLPVYDVRFDARGGVSVEHAFDVPTAD